MIKALIAGAMLLVSTAASTAIAQDYPSRVVRIIVPYSAGGGTDVFMRAVAKDLHEMWGQPVIIDNQPGAGSLIGASATAKAAPDGYTLMATTNQTVISNRYLFKQLPYDPDRSFEPVSLMIRGDVFMLANPSLPVTNLRDLVSLAKRQPGKLAYGSYGIASEPHLIYETLNQREGLDLLHVPFKGVANQLPAVVSGEVQLGMGSAGVAGALLEAGKVKAIAIAAPDRLAEYPDVPTTVELGYPYLQSAIWYGLFAPAGTPASIVEKLSADVRKVINSPDFSGKKVSKGRVLIGNSPKEFAALIQEEQKRVGEMIRAAKVEPQ